MELDSTNYSDDTSEVLIRWLDYTGEASSDQEMLRNRILYIAYLCVLGCCCITPCLYYIRVSSWQRRQFREFREMERNAILAALAQSTANSVHHMNITAELAIVHSERRARIIQLMEPVRMTLQEKHFQRSPSQSSNQSNDVAENEVLQSDEVTSNHRSERKMESEAMSLSNPNSFTTDDLTVPSPMDSGFDHDEESILIHIPSPGLNVRNVLSSDGTTTVQGTARTNALRWVPGFCTICLSAFEVGHDIVWSSNANCDHCFHTDCMQQWLTKQQRSVNAEGPVCPCCRRDFVIDPYDLVSVQPPLAEDGTDRSRYATAPNLPVDTEESSHLTCPLGDDERRTATAP